MNAKRMKLQNSLAAMLLMLAAVPAGAQRYGYRLPLPPVTASGFYRIAITPTVTARCLPDSRDLRLADAAGKEQPYLIEASAEMLRERGFQPFDMLSHGKGNDGNTQITLRNSAPGEVDEILLQVRNTTAVRTTSVSGSNDGKTFFSLRDSVLMEAVSGSAGDTATYAIALPRTSYPYLRLTIFDKAVLPLDVLRGGIFKDRLSGGARRISVPAPVFRQTDSSDHRSYIFLHFDAPYRVDRLSFSFGGAHLFKRAATLYDGNDAVAELSISRAAPATAWMQLHTTDVALVVENEDNPPLRLQSVTAEQTAQHLLAYLEAGTGYALRFGDSTLAAPVYDLRYFKDSISRLSLPILTPAAAIERVQIAPAAMPPKPPLLGKGAMWAIILIVLAGLVWATIGMMRQMKRRVEQS